MPAPFVFKATSKALTAMTRTTAKSNKKLAAVLQFRLLHSQIAVIGHHIYQTVAGETEKYCLWDTFLPCPEGFPDYRSNGMGGFRSRHDALCLGKHNSGPERLFLPDIHGLYPSVDEKAAGNRSRPVIPETSGMDTRRRESMT